MSEQSPETLVFDCDLDEPPHQVWRALTEPDLLAAWLGPNDVRPEVGHRFSIDADPASETTVHCEVLEADPDRRLTWSWREERAGGEALESEVTWTITPRFDGGAHLRIVHDGFALIPGRVLALAGASVASALAQRVRRRLDLALRPAA